jgi:hypothetical protein
MSEQSTHPNAKRQQRKAGRTLLVKPNGNVSSNMFNSLTGLVNNTHTEKSNSYFLTFDTVGNAVNAYRHFRKNYTDTVRVKFAFYRVFFTLQNLTDTTDYSQVKTAHMNFVRTASNGRVLFYKLYRKNNNYLGCGDMTLDTKESFDSLVSQESQHKNFTLLNNLTGVHFKYNRNSESNQRNNAPVATV